MCYCTALVAYLKNIILPIFKMLTLEKSAEKWSFSTGGGSSDGSEPPPLATGLHQCEGVVESWTWRQFDHGRLLWRLWRTNSPVDCCIGFSHWSRSHLLCRLLITCWRMRRTDNELMRRRRWYTHVVSAPDNCRRAAWIWAATSNYVTTNAAGRHIDDIDDVRQRVHLGR